jgi:hypothetical protein
VTIKLSWILLDCFYEETCSWKQQFSLKQRQNVTQYAEEEKSDDNINARNIDAQIIDKMLEDKISTRMRNKL